MPQPSIFVSHTREQQTAVRRLTSELTSRGFSIATNRHTVPPGKRIQPAVEQAIASADRCLICFSAKPGGPTEYDADDVRLANERVQQQPDDSAWLIPVKLTDCDLSAVDLGGSPAKGLGAIELQSEWEAAFERLMLTLPAPPEGEPAARQSHKAARATVSEKIDAVMGGEIVMIGVDGVPDADVSVHRDVKTITGDKSVVITGINGKANRP
ncbi:MAG TPA: toll/interleukin-1 receptor domain-containing protein [Thermoanaerobaculia bacterium]|nr:toll/interleukin-1 receptor domain-containing protein [Thermoanaerobaculia bacterium]